MINEFIVMRIHDRMIVLYGGLSGMPDSSRITGILGRVDQLRFYDESIVDDFDVAALYLMAIARGHIFNDANERTALAVALFYLGRNNILIRNDDEAEELHQDMTIRAAIGELEIREIADYFRRMVM